VGSNPTGSSLYFFLFRSLMVEHVAVNHGGAGSNPVESYFLF
jgi:hypothetical protein